MKYELLEDEYKSIFKRKVLPFIEKSLSPDFRSAPIYYLLNNLQINRFRSGLPILLARECDFDENKLVPLAALCELTFTTAMAQDDFYDDDRSREGTSAAHVKFGAKETLLACDYGNHKILAAFIDSIYPFISSKTLKEVIKIVNKELAAAYASVLMELESKKDIFSVTESYLRELYLNKTAHGRMLLECTFRIVFGDAEEKKISSIKEYSDNLAIAGQLKNDLYDYTKHKKYRGLSDLRQGHITWPLYLYLKDLDENRRKEFLRRLDNQEHELLVRAFKEAKMVEKTLKLIDFHVESAKKKIDPSLPQRVQALLSLWAEGNRHFSKSPEL